jgi:CBS domain-containing membrane protein
LKALNWKAPTRHWFSKVTSILGLAAPHWREQRRAGLLVCLALGLAAALSRIAPVVQVAPALGASALLLGALPASPVSKPWPLLGGTLLSAVVAWVVALPGWPLLITAPIAVTAALLLMYTTRSLHPPGGAMALWVLLHTPAFASPWPVLLAITPGLLLLMGLAHLRDQLFADRDKPQPASHQTRDPSPMQRQRPSSQDWQRALARHEQLLDVGAEQLDTLYQELEASRLHGGLTNLTIGDIMSRDLVTLPPQASGLLAWQTLQQHKINMVPIVDGGRVVGVIALVDLLKRLGLVGKVPSADLASRIDYLMQQPVGALMVTPARTALQSTKIDALVPLLSDWGLHHLPVVADDGTLVGIVTQSDLIAALANKLAHRTQGDEGGAPLPLTQ